MGKELPWLRRCRWREPHPHPTQLATPVLQACRGLDQTDPPRNRGESVTSVVTFVDRNEPKPVLDT